ncbi:MAG: HAD family phosphatase [Pedobacter sp.]
MENTPQLKPKAFLFDLNGTMIDDMQFHATAWSSILNDDLGAGLSLEQVKLQMYGKNTELLERVFGKGRFSKDQEQEIFIKKEEKYQAEYLSHMKLIDGLHGIFVEALGKGIKLAIGSAASPFNINYILDNLDIRHYFEAIVSADDVEISKPDPETFLKAAKILGVPAEQCIVFEDAPKGVEAAKYAGMKAVVLTTMHKKEDFEPGPHIIGFISDYTDPLLSSLFA